MSKLVTGSAILLAKVEKPQAHMFTSRENTTANGSWPIARYLSTWKAGSSAMDRMRTWAPWSASPKPLPHPINPKVNPSSNLIDEPGTRCIYPPVSASDLNHRSHCLPINADRWAAPQKKNNLIYLEVFNPCAVGTDREKPRLTFAAQQKTAWQNLLTGIRFKS